MKTLMIVMVLLWSVQAEAKQSPEKVAKSFLSRVIMPKKDLFEGWFPFSIMTSQYANAVKTDNKYDFPPSNLLYGARVKQSFRWQKHYHQSQKVRWGGIVARRIFDGFERQIWVQVISTSSGWKINDCTEFPNVTRAKLAIKKAIARGIVPKFNWKQEYWWAYDQGASGKEALFSLVVTKDFEVEYSIDYRMRAGSVTVSR